MAPIWYKYYEECRSVLYVVDATDAHAAQTAASQLQGLLQHQALKVMLVKASSSVLSTCSLFPALLSFRIIRAYSLCYSREPHMLQSKISQHMLQP